MAKRQSIMFPGFSHQNPIPNASRIGNIVMSSVIGPSNPGTRDIPPTLEAQVANLFIHLRAAITAAGGTPTGSTPAVGTVGGEFASFWLIVNCEKSPKPRD